MAISKRLRFEIFKRDGFTCQYCGQRPPDVILELDHIDPRCAGGTDDEINLTTSCYDCNRGKAGKKLGDVKPRPDADLKYFELQQEISEAKRYSAAVVEREKALSVLMKSLEALWIETVDTEWVPSAKQWRAWLAYYSPEEVEYAMRVTGPRMFSGKFGKGSYSINQAMRYMSAVMRNRRQDEEAGRGTGTVQ